MLFYLMQERSVFCAPDPNVVVFAACRSDRPANGKYHRSNCGIVSDEFSQFRAVRKVPEDGLCVRTSAKDEVADGGVSDRFDSGAVAESNLSNLPQGDACARKPSNAKEEGKKEPRWRVSREY